VAVYGQVGVRPDGTIPEGFEVQDEQIVVAGLAKPKWVVEMETVAAKA
jgi:hypothetical protein